VSNFKKNYHSKIKDRKILFKKEKFLLK
jgi:hypothetical protein